MAGPEYDCRRLAAQPELRLPKRSAQSQRRASSGRQPVAMERHMARFVAQDQPAHVGERRVGRMTAQDPIVRGADQFGEQQDLQFECDTQHTAAQTKRRETPVRRNAAASEAVYRATEQPGVFGLLRKPEINDRPHLIAAAPEPFGVVSDQRGRAAAVAEPELLQRGEERGEDFRPDGYGRGPVRFRTVASVPFEVRYPFCVVHGSH